MHVIMFVYIEYSHSKYLPDYNYPIITLYRFAALTRNIRERRGSKVDIKMPLYRDIKTPEYLRLADQQNKAKMGQGMNGNSNGVNGMSNGVSNVVNTAVKNVPGVFSASSLAEMKPAEK